MAPQSKEGKTSIAQYLLDRLAQLGVKSIFGVPGDFNLGFLDLVDDHPQLDWVGNCNELNAAYAADGYARVSGTIGALITTFGVGELSAMNGVAGAFAERVPMIHIVGVPATSLQDHHALLHHTLGDGRFDAFRTAAKQVTAAQAYLEGAKNSAGVDAGAEIDRVLRIALEQARPVYLTLPTDLVYAEIDAARLKEPLTKGGIHEAKSSEVDSKLENFVVDKIAQMFEGRQRPVVLIDSCAVRYGVTSQISDLISATGMKFFTSPMGKGALPESHPNFGGVYIGDITKKEVKEAFESADFVLSIGALLTDFNSGGFSYRLEKESLVELHSDHTKIQYALYEGVTFFRLLPLLASRLSSLKSSSSVSSSITVPSDAGLASSIPSGAESSPIKQDAFWPMWGAFFKKGDVILAETGTSSFGILDTKLPDEAILVVQVLWGSIGYTGGAVLGASMAAREKGRRTILFIGDGSLQLTVQELSTCIREGTKPIIVLLNNSGYTIERKIHGETRKYNDIQDWKWRSILDTFNGKPDEIANHKVSTRAELVAILENEEFAKADKITMLEVIMDKHDAPRALIEQAEATSKNNAY